MSKKEFPVLFPGQKRTEEEAHGVNEKVDGYYERHLRRVFFGNRSVR